MSNDVKHSDVFETFLGSYVQELIEMSDSDILDGVDPAVVKEESLAMLELARKKAGKERLVLARNKLSKTKLQSSLGNVTPEKARAFLRHIANDSRYTLAARELTGISDDEAVRLYSQLRRLEESQTDEDGTR